MQGPKVVHELLGSNWPVVEVFATAERAERMGLRHATIVPAFELERIGTLDSGNDVIAVVQRPADEGPVADVGPDELVLALDGIRDPGNLGTLIRIADWFGVKRLWCARGSVDPYNPKTVQAAMGALFRVPVAVVDLPVQLERQLEAGVALYLASMEGRSVFEVDLARRAVLVLGSESHGLSPELRALQATLIGIPGGGGSESLNVATAAAALCMEFTRQRLA